MERILLTEDNQDNADLVCALLDDVYEVTVTNTANEAIAHLDGLAQADYPAVLMLDISLPGMDGIELLRELRGRDQYRSIPALAVTAHAMKDDRNRLLAVGFDDYVSKPIDGDELIATIRRLLAKRP
jgi:CheY-like chemotaxis protein